MMFSDTKNLTVHGKHVSMDDAVMHASESYGSLIQWFNENHFGFYKNKYNTVHQVFIIRKTDRNTLASFLEHMFDDMSFTELMNHDDYMRLYALYGSHPAVVNDGITWRKTCRNLNVPKNDLAKAVLMLKPFTELIRNAYEYADYYVIPFTVNTVSSMNNVNK